MKAEIISIGTELLLGHNIDTNSAYIANSLSRIGIDIFYHTTVGDNKERLAGAIKDALSRADIVITIGGLGPTVDDITIGTIASLLKRDLVFKKGILDSIKTYFKKKGLKLPKDAIKQALIPRNAIWFKNDVGTAPGIIIKEEKHQIIALPGPPRELRPIMARDIIPHLKKARLHPATIGSKSLRIIGMPEAKVNEKVKDLLKLSGHTTVGIYTHLGEVELKITAKAENEKTRDKYIKKIEHKIRQRLGTLIYGVDNETLNDTVGALLLKKKKSIAIAESCTGGLISDLITNTSGSSKYFIMGIVAYNDSVKINSLNIKKDIIKKSGAVSKEVARQMADNIRDIAKTDIGIGITGIAGPKGGSKKKPVGLVFIAISTKKKKLVKEFRFLGARQEIKLQTANEALNLLRLNI